MSFAVTRTYLGNAAVKLNVRAASVSNIATMPLGADRRPRASRSTTA